MKIQATFEYAGFADYWGGCGKRWDDNSGCLFAYYGRDTTVRDIVDQWCDDYIMGGDCDSFPENVDSDDIREAILEMLSDSGRADYESGALFDLAADLDEDSDDFESPICVVLIELYEDSN